MIMQLYEEDGFSDEFESKVIENIVKRSSNVYLLKADGNSQSYILKKKAAINFKEELQEEKMRQREKSLFKKKSTRTLKELRIMISILEILENDHAVTSDEVIALFVIKADELLDI